MSSQKESDLYARREEIFQKMVEGSNFNSIATRNHVKSSVIRNMMQTYKPYRDWVRVHFDAQGLSPDFVRKMRRNGYSMTEISDLLNVDYEMVHDIVKDVERRDKTFYYQIVEIENQSLVNVSDVDKFRDMVMIGQQLCYDETDDGILLFCIVEEKYKHFAKTDRGAYEWNWLCVKNKELIGK